MITQTQTQTVKETQNSVRMNALKDIIQHHLGVDVIKDKSRTKEKVEARMMFSYIMHEKGYGPSEIGRFLKKDHTSVIHYLKTFPWYLKTDKALSEDYAVVRKSFVNDLGHIFEFTNSELTKEIFFLQNKINDLYSEQKQLKDSIESSYKTKGRLQNIFKLIQERTRIGAEDEVLKKLNHFYNGLQ
jgi:hypothetical protein